MVKAFVPLIIEQQSRDGETGIVVNVGSSAGVVKEY